MQLPTLSAGRQEPGSGKVCAEQAVNWLVSGRLDLGDETDHPSCVQPVLSALSIRVNDLLPDSRRGEMWPLILAQPGTARPDMEPGLSVALAKWCADHVAPRVGTHAAAAVYDASYAIPASSAAYAASAVYDAIHASAAAHAAIHAIYAAHAAAAASAAALIVLLAGCQAEHARLTGHTPTPIPQSRINRLKEITHV